MTGCRRWGLALLGLALAPVSFSAWAVRDLAADLKPAQAALAAGDMDKAYQGFLEYGEDNPLAQFTLGLFHQYGWGRPVDAAESCRWQEKAAQGNIPAAQQQLAECLRRGILRPADPTGAAHWYEQAALAGIGTAWCDLADLYMAGEGVAKDPHKALDVCKKGAEMGLPIAQAHLARFYLEGDESIRDPVMALRWMQAAAQANNVEAQYRLGLMLRDGVGQAADAANARFWLESAATEGWLSAYQPTAELYFFGPVDADTGLLPAADLAKAYLWSSAAVHRWGASKEGEAASALLAKVLTVMPASWRPDLDLKVSEHLAKIGEPHVPPPVQPPVEHAHTGP